MGFFKYNEQQMVVNAKIDDHSYGRLINHSKLHPNLVTKPFQEDEADDVTLIFRAATTIDIGDQPFFDYDDKDENTPEWMNGHYPGLCNKCVALLKT
jgi:hypothetical protein